MGFFENFWVVWGAHTVVRGALLHCDSLLELLSFLFFINYKLLLAFSLYLNPSLLLALHLFSTFMFLSYL